MAYRPAILAKVIAAIVVLVSAGCGTTEKVPRTPSINVYEEYLEFVNDLGGDVLDRGDAGFRASLLCSGTAKELLRGVPIGEFPTDLALIRAYCPDEEAEYD